MQRVALLVNSHKCIRLRHFPSPSWGGVRGGVKHRLTANAPAQASPTCELLATTAPYPNASRPKDRCLLPDAPRSCNRCHLHDHPRLARGARRRPHRTRRTNNRLPNPRPHLEPHRRQAECVKSRSVPRLNEPAPALRSRNDLGGDADGRNSTRN